MTMKRISDLAVLGFVLFGATSLWAGQGIRWETDFKTAMEIAQETDRFVLIHFYGDQCPPCRAMEKGVFSQQMVADAIAPYFVPLKINTEQNPKAVQNLNITSIPTDLIVTPQREIIFRRKGGCSASQYVEELLSVLPMLQTPRKAELSDAERLQIAQVQHQPQPLQNQSVLQTERQPPGLQVPQAQTMPIQTTPPQTALAEMPQETPGLLIPTGEDDFFLPHMPLTLPTEDPSEMILVDYAAPAATTDALHSHGLTGLSIPNLQATDEQENPGHESPYILDGFCPVELQEHERWTAGKTEFSLHYRDRFFLFSSKEAMIAFSKNSHHYIPVAMGEDVVQMLQGGQRIKGKRHYGAWYQGRIYLFTTQENYNVFAERPSYFADFALKLESALGQTQISTANK